VKVYRPGDAYRYAQYKLDGHSLRIEKDESGRLRAFTSHPHDITDGVKNLVFTGGMYELMPRGTILLGELWYPGEHASFVKTAVKHQYKDLRFHCFAVRNFIPGLPLMTVDHRCRSWGIPFIPWSRMTSPELIQHLISQPLPNFLGGRIEGWVFKNGNFGSEAKWKPIKTMDVIVTGYKDGRGKHLGLVGSLKCSVHGPDGLVPVANAGGMNDLERATISDDCNEYLGRVCEVKYQYVGSKGKLRHPRFVRWRDDKPAEFCFTNQDLELERYVAKNH
jgi:hypothetical protein